MPNLGFKVGHPTVPGFLHYLHLTCLLTVFMYCIRENCMYYVLYKGELLNSLCYLLVFAMQPCSYISSLLEVLFFFLNSLGPIHPLRISSSTVSPKSFTQNYFLLAPLFWLKTVPSCIFVLQHSIHMFSKYNKLEDS